MPTPTPTPTPAPCVPPPPPGGCYECPPGSGHVICVDGPYEYVPPVPTLSDFGLAALAIAVALAGLRRLRS